MANVIVSKEIKVPAGTAWEKFASFRGIEEFSPIERSVTEGNGAGATRTCYLPDGAAIHEVLNKVENSAMELEYEITDGPFPVSRYVSTIKVAAKGDNRCEVTWGCEFDSADEHKEEMSNLFGGFYNVIIDGLENLVNNQN